MHAFASESSVLLFRRKRGLSLSKTLYPKSDLANHIPNALSTRGQLDAEKRNAIFKGGHEMHVFSVEDCIFYPKNATVCSKLDKLFVFTNEKGINGEFLLSNFTIIENSRRIHRTICKSTKYHQHIRNIRSYNKDKHVLTHDRTWQNSHSSPRIFENTLQYSNLEMCWYFGVLEI